MEHFQLQAYMLAELYKALRKNPQPTDNTRGVMRSIEDRMKTLSMDIAQTKEVTKPKFKTEDDEIPF